MMNTVIPVENEDVLKAVRGFLRSLMASGAVEALFVPLEVSQGFTQPALVTDADRLELANPLAMVMPINNARAVSALTGKHTPKPLGVVLRACELRALIELVKLQQASLENVITIGFDCLGTSKPADALMESNREGGNLGDYLAAAKQGESLPDSLPLRQTCQMCIQPEPHQADIHFMVLNRAYTAFHILIRIILIPRSRASRYWRAALQFRTLSFGRRRMMSGWSRF